MLPTSRAETALAAFLLCLALAASAHGRAAAATVTDQRLSDEHTVTYWADASRREPIRSAPSPDSQIESTLRLTTELGAPEVYLALRRHVGADGASWIETRIPARPNGRTGWVPEDALGDLQVTYTALTISLRDRRARLSDSGKQIWSAPIGVGKPGTPTPRGHFYVRERLRLGGNGGAYGSFAFGTSAYSNRLTDWPGGGVVGIHGTNQPRLIPGRISHGCIRLRNPDDRDLRRLMGLGTPVWIR